MYIKFPAQLRIGELLGGGGDQPGQLSNISTKLKFTLTITTDIIVSQVVLRL